jgi:thiol-disulfide isomerase/thioredoxin
LLIAELITRRADVSLGSADIRALQREINPADEFWGATSLSAVQMWATAAVEFPGRRTIDVDVQQRYRTQLDSLLGLPVLNPHVRDDLLLSTAVVARRLGDSTAALAALRRIETESPRSDVLPLARSLIAPSRAVRNGRAIPTFTVADLAPGAAPITSDALRAKVTLLDLWATWCGPCVAERPMLAEAYAKWKSKGFDIISIGFDSDVEVERRFLASRPELSWRHGIIRASGDVFKSEVGRAFEIFGLPRTLLVDSSGRVVVEHVVPIKGELETHLSRLLGAP